MNGIRDFLRGFSWEVEEMPSTWVEALVLVSGLRFTKYTYSQKISLNQRV